MNDFLERRADSLRRRMVAALVSRGVLHDPRWRSAFTQVPRHAFVPRYFRQHPHGGWTAVKMGDLGWLPEVYSDRVLVTQLDGDEGRWDIARRDGAVDGVPTCSSSMPTIMSIMLEALCVHTGQRVLEIGTGTGYNAALLCHRLGDRSMSTMDVDPVIVEQARERLADCGYHPTAVAGDGELGYPRNAPYDRILATCAVSTIPLSWLDQTRPGGVVITTLYRHLGAGLVRITAGEGPRGRGRVLREDGRFMPLRAHERPAVVELLDRAVDQPGQTRPTRVPANLVTDSSSPFEFFAGLALPGAVATPSLHRGGADQAWLLHPDGSWVRHHTEHRRHVVEQGGARRLWDEIEAAHRQWQELGAPRRDRFGITVSPEGQELWLDYPTSPHRWPLQDS
jgi:methyltransferase of ATP-grasp peptide maturase system